MDQLTPGALDSLWATIRALESQVARLSGERDAMKEAADGMARAPYGEFAKWVDRALAAEVERERLREALGFYADPLNYEEGIEPHPARFATGIVPVEHDAGAIARAALSAGAEQEGKDA